MKKVVILLVSIMCFLLVGCGSSSNKILGIVELNITTKDELSSLNLKNHTIEQWNSVKENYEYVYKWHYTDYELDDINGEIRLHFEDNTDNATVDSVVFSAEATTENKSELLSYLIDTYGKDYYEEDHIKFWKKDDLIIYYSLTEEDTVEATWYKSE